MAETVLISGASGLVGKPVTRALRARGYDVRKLVRRPVTDPDEVHWNPAGAVDYPLGYPLHHVIHLAGESVMGLWTLEKKQHIRASRVQGTRTIAAFCAQRKPKTLVSASAIGIYGSRGDEILTETSAPGSGFLADVAREWEAAADPARAAGVRVVHPRIGVVLAKDGGALKSMLLPFQLGVGGRVGSGDQWLSWITLADLVAIIVLAIENPTITGAINGTAPHPVTNAEFSKTLAFVLNRPAILPLPALVLRLLPGNMAEETLLASERVLPHKLVHAGYDFQHAELYPALQAVLGVTVD